jgi:hypothetical protein
MTRAKVGLGLIHQLAAYIGEPASKELDLHMVRYVTGKCKLTAEQDPSLITNGPSDHSDLFYGFSTSQILMKYIQMLLRSLRHGLTIQSDQ